MRRRDWLGFPLLLTGCSVLPERAYQPVRAWPLIVPAPEARPVASRAPVLLLRPTRAAAGMERRGLQTLRPDGSLAINPYEEWVAPPADAITDQLQGWLAGCGLFSAVVLPGSRLTAQYVLEAQLTALWTIKATSRARASLSFVLINQRAGSAAILQGVADGDATVTDATPPSQASAQLSALADAFRQIVRHLTATPLHG